MTDRQGRAADRVLPASQPPEDATRILAIVPRTRYSGLAVLDRWGLVERGFRVWNLHAAGSIRVRCAAVRERTRIVVRRFRPALVVIAAAGRREDAPLVASARRAIAELGIECEVAAIGPAKALLIGRSAAPRRDLPGRIVRGFFPELASFFSQSPERERYWRAGFLAVAVALAVLVRRRPFQAAALAHAEAFDSNDLAQALARAAANHSPHL